TLSRRIRVRIGAVPDVARVGRGAEWVPSTTEGREDRERDPRPFRRPGSGATAGRSCAGWRHRRPRPPRRHRPLARPAAVRADPAHHPGQPDPHLSPALDPDAVGADGRAAPAGIAGPADPDDSLSHHPTTGGPDRYGPG